MDKAEKQGIHSQGKFLWFTKFRPNSGENFFFTIPKRKSLAEFVCVVKQVKRDCYTKPGPWDQKKFTMLS